MRRQEFVDQLTKISVFNSEILNVKEIPLFCCRQFKMNSRTVKPHNSQQPLHHLQKGSPMHQEKVVVFINNKQSQRVVSAFDGREDSLRKHCARRILTSPSPSSLKKRIPEKDLEHALSIKLENNKGQMTPGGYISQKSTETKHGSCTVPCEYETEAQAVSRRVLKLGNLSLKKHADSGTIQRERLPSQAKYQSLRPEGLRQSPVKQINMNQQKAPKRSLKVESIPAPPKITAKSYIIYEIKSNPSDSKVIFSFNSKNSQEVASLTKIMTCTVTLEVCDRFKVDKSTEEVVIGQMEARMGGTTADLEPGQVYTIQQLLYGLMLPSGNDASVALAVWAGRKLLHFERQNTQPKSPDQPWKKMKSTLSCMNTTTKSNILDPKKAECYNRFLREMNAKARQLNMSKTNYANSHGLVNQNNKSSAYDIALLCDYAMRNQQFRTIVKTPYYRGVIRVRSPQEDSIAYDSSSEVQSIDGDEYQEESLNLGSSLKPHCLDSSLVFLQRAETKVEPNKVILQRPEKKIEVEWENTHKLIHSKPGQYLGIKTGYTTMAGPCLCSCLQAEGRQFIVVVLGCSKMGLRFKETEALKKWLFKREGMKKRTLLEKAYNVEDGQQDGCQYKYSITTQQIAHSQAIL